MQKGGLYNDKYTVPSERNARYVTHVTKGNIFLNSCNSVNLTYFSKIFHHEFHKGLYYTFAN